MRNRVLASILTLCLLFALIPVTAAAAAEEIVESGNGSIQTGDTLEKANILFIGNSYTEDAREYIRYIFDQYNYEGDITLGHLYSGGKTLAYYANCAREETGYSTYYGNATKDIESPRAEGEDGDNTLVYYKSTNGSIAFTSQGEQTIAYAMEDEDWDIVIIQGHSAEQIYGGTYNTNFAGNLEYLTNYIKSFDSTVEIGWYMTWRRAAETFEDRLEKYWETIQKTVLENSNIDFVVPIGTAVENARTTFLEQLDYTSENTSQVKKVNLLTGEAISGTMTPDNNGSLYRDGNHLSAVVGRFLAAYTMGEVLMQRISERDGITYTISEPIQEIYSYDSSIGKLPAVYVEIVKASVEAAIGSPYTVTTVSSYSDDPATEAETKLKQATYSYTAVDVTDKESLVTAIQTTVTTELEEIATGFKDPVVTVTSDFTAPTEDVPTDFTATVSIQFGYTFKENIEVSGTVSVASSEGYTITVNGEIANGTVTASPQNASENDIVTITVEPDDGYALDVLTVTNESTGSPVTLTKVNDILQYTFIMPASNVTVDADLSEVVNVEDTGVTTTASDGETTITAAEGETPEETVAIRAAVEDLKVSTTENGSLAQAVSNLSEISAAVQSTTEYQKATAVAADSEITIHVETALSVTINSAEVSGGAVIAVGVEISPVYTVYVYVNGTKVAEFANAYELGGEDLAVSGTVTIQMTVPSGLDYENGGTLYIQHKGYEYSAEVKNGSITFDNPHGFSEFVINTQSKAVAQSEKNGTVYTSLQTAVNDASNRDIITVSSADGEGLTATTSKTITIKNGTSEPISVTINGKTYTIAADGEETVSSNSGSSSNDSSSNVSTTYSITMEDETKNGTITLSNTEACAGDAVTITVTPDRYYALDSLVVTNSKGRELDVTDNGDGTYTFTMPASKVTIEVTFEMDEDFLLFLEILAGAAASNTQTSFIEGYTDLDVSAWYAEAVNYVVEQGLMTGTSATTFEPNTVTNRAMLVTILYRLEGEPAVTGTSGFTDVVDGAWYADAVTWAAQNGIVNGLGDGLYGVYNTLTREQMAAILYRYAQYKGYDVSVGASTNILSYTDALEIGEWAVEAMQWANGAGLITGVTESTLAPQSDSTRAVMATILMRFCENVAK